MAQVNITALRFANLFHSVTSNIVFDYLYRNVEGESNDYTGLSDAVAWERAIANVMDVSLQFFNSLENGGFDQDDTQYVISLEGSEERIKTRNTMRRMLADGIHIAAHSYYDEDSEEFLSDSRGNYYTDFDPNLNIWYDQSRAD